jgi:hypothetical protein
MITEKTGQIERDERDSGIIAKPNEITFAMQINRTSREQGMTRLFNL